MHNILVWLKNMTGKKRGKIIKLAFTFMIPGLVFFTGGWMAAQPRSALPPNFTDTLVATVGKGNLTASPLRRIPDAGHLVRHLRVYQGSTFRRRRSTCLCHQATLNEVSWGTGL